MVVERHKRTFGIFLNYQALEQALNKLSSSGFLMEQISVVVKQADIDEQLGGAGEFFCYQAQTGTATSVVGSLLGAICGCLVGIGILAVPGVGPFIAVGTSGTALTMTLAGAGIGVVSSGLISTLNGSEITLDRVDRNCRSQTEYLVVVNGTDDEVRHADSILGRS
jgi:hypothetical protein